ncbi:MAG: phosphatidylglycerol lysyltransferase [Spirochaetes bacterium]|nr:phosphatidylglycerol lysyltransferase [Spirochaetota bacterium]
MAVLDKMILSASGWRGVFAAGGGEEDPSKEITAEYRTVAAAAAFVFAGYLKGLPHGEKPLALVASDTRPTSGAIAGAVIPALLASGCRVRYAGYAAAPEVMAWARSLEGEKPCGFVYISASHNPIGYNGFKFGLTDGGVLPAGEAAKLTAALRSVLEEEDCAVKMEALMAAAGEEALQEVYSGEAAAKAQALKAYFDFCGLVAWGAAGGTGGMEDAVKEGLKKRPLGIVCDFNGSARAASIDRDFFASLGLKFTCINDQPGRIAHRIVPEGDALEPCRQLLEKARVELGEEAFLLGYVPDCDGDRGNIVIWDRHQKAARPLEAQEVFALACLAELAHLVWTGEIEPPGKWGRQDGGKAAVAVNDATSMRVDRIAAAFDVDAFRAEVGEANVVSLARLLRERGYIVRILGEGAAGGSITHPSAVRDPVNTVMALAKLLTVRGGGGKDGLFKLWCDLSGQPGLYREDFCLADIIASLPAFVTTPAYDKEALLRVSEKDPAALKGRYQKVFLSQWGQREQMLKERFGICGWEASGFSGTDEMHGIENFADAGSGGLRICFNNDRGRVIAAIWMRPSATEPVLRIMADVEGRDENMERELRQWQRGMIMEADE